MFACAHVLSLYLTLYMYACARGVDHHLIWSARQEKREEKEQKQEQRNVSFHDGPCDVRCVSA